MIYGKGRTPNRTLDIVYGGINSEVNRMEGNLEALELYFIRLVLVLPLLSKDNVYFYSFILHSFPAPL